jgi:hypothetical protein
MKKVIFALSTLTSSVIAQAGDHYVPGVEGIQS